MVILNPRSWTTSGEGTWL